MARHLAEPGYVEAVLGHRRLLVFGSGDWEDQSTIVTAIVKQWDRFKVDGAQSLTVVTGIEGTVEAMVASATAASTVRVEAHPSPDRIPYPFSLRVRNANMVSLGADHALIFMRNGDTRMQATANLVEGAGIPITLYRVDDGLTR